MKIVERIVCSFWVKIISIIVIVLDFAFLIIGFALGDAAHELHTIGLFITCFVDVILGLEIILDFYYMYQKSIKEKLEQKANELSKEKVGKQIELLQAEIEQINKLGKFDMIAHIDQWYNEGRQICKDQESINKYVSQKYNEHIKTTEEEFKKLAESTKKIIMEEIQK